MSIALVVPSYNEEDRIGLVLEAAAGSALLTETIVVDDGSFDRTAEVAREYGVKVIVLAENIGKGGAMQAGIEATDADIIAFSDADIIGLTPSHFNLLIEPLLLDPELTMTIGKFSGGRLRTDWSQNLIPAISGQRAIRREFLTDLPDLIDARFGVEMLITRHAKNIEAKTCEVILEDLTQVMKEEKLGVVKGVSARMRMYQDIFKTFLK